MHLGASACNEVQPVSSAPSKPKSPVYNSSVNKIEKLRLDQRSALSAPCASERIRVYWCSFVVENRLCPAYPRLSAPKRGKTRLNGPNRANNFPGGSRASIRACAPETATAPQQPATSRTNSHLLARLAPTCAGKNFCRFVRSLRVLCAFVVNSRHIGKSSHIKPNKGKYNQLKRPGFSPHNLNHNPNLNRGNQTTPKVGYCRRSRNRPGLSPLNLNTSRSAGLQTGKLRGIPASLAPCFPCPSCLSSPQIHARHPLVDFWRGTG